MIQLNSKETRKQRYNAEVTAMSDVLIAKSHFSSCTIYGSRSFVNTFTRRRHQTPSRTTSLPTKCAHASTFRNNIYDPSF